MRGRGGVHGGGVPGARLGWVGVGHATGQAGPRTGPTTHCSLSLTSNRI
jgi:hypothetical protein